MEQEQNKQQEEVQGKPSFQSLNQKIDLAHKEAAEFFGSSDEDPESGNCGFYLCIAADGKTVNSRFSLCSNIAANEMAAYIAYHLTKRPSLAKVLMDALRMLMVDQFEKLEELGCKPDEVPATKRGRG